MEYNESKETALKYLKKYFKPHYFTEKHTEVKALANLLKKNSNRLVTQWVAVENRLPNYEDRVFVAYKFFSTERNWDTGLLMGIGYLESIGKYGANFRVEKYVERLFQDNDSQKVTHWMPLPSKPSFNKQRKSHKE